MSGPLDVIAIYRDGVAELLKKQGVSVALLNRQLVDQGESRSAPILHYYLGECRVVVRFKSSYAEVCVLSEQNCSGVGAAEYADPQFLEKLSAVLDLCHGRIEAAK